MVSFSPCKINLGLHITGKRPDDYHDLETCFYPVPWMDIVEVIPSDTLSFTTTGDTIPGNAADNLCLKAYSLLKRDFNIDAVKIYLHKIIPTGAGLGGGSSDGAHTLRLLNEVFNLNLDREALMRYAAQLGSDCAFFIQDKPMMGSGRGEILKETVFSLRGKFLLLVKPAVHVSTAEAYAGVTPQRPTLRVSDIVEQYPLDAWRDMLKNDFESSVFKKYPVIGDIKNALYAAGAVYASMSGSGAAVFGIFEKEVPLGGFSSYTTWYGVL